MDQTTPLTVPNTEKNTTTTDPSTEHTSSGSLLTTNFVLIVDKRLTLTGGKVTNDSLLLTYLGIGSLLRTSLRRSPSRFSLKIKTHRSAYFCLVPKSHNLEKRVTVSTPETFKTTSHLLTR